jgi:peptide chain release factor 1
MQTSAAGVVVVPKIEVPQVIIRDSDLKISISKKSSGAGGQSVNAAYQQVRMTHMPSGFTVVVNESHAQQENKEIAYAKVKARVQMMEEEKALAAMANSRKGQVRTADRSEKIRSYNFQRGEVNDHRLPNKDGGVVKESCEDFMTDCGSLVRIWENLRERNENEQINGFIIETIRKQNS